MLFCHLQIFGFENNFFQEIVHEYSPAVCLTVLIQTRPNMLLGLIWIQKCLQRLSTGNKCHHLHGKRYDDEIDYGYHPSTLGRLNVEFAIVSKLNSA